MKMRRSQQNMDSVTASAPHGNQILGPVDIGMLSSSAKDQDGPASHTVTTSGNSPLPNGPSGRFQVVTALERPDLYKMANNDDSHPIIVVWPKYFDGPKEQHEAWSQLSVLPGLARFQFMVLDGRDGDATPRVVAQANSVPLHRRVCADGDFEPLPDGGMYAALTLGVQLELERSTGVDASVEPNVLSALSIAVDGEYRNKGLATLLLRALKRAAMAAGYSRLVVPARPTLKHLYPDVDMASYMLWTRPGVELPAFPRAKDAARVFDPWLRRHVSEGARFAKIAPSSMEIKGDVATWTAWLDGDIFREMRNGIFKDTGEVMLPLAGGLTRLCYDMEKGVARYTEPNVWMEYDLR